MARLAAVAAPHLCRGIRRCPAPPPDGIGLAESFRLFFAQRPYPVRHWSRHRRFVVAGRLSTAGRKGVDLYLKESLSISTLCAVDVSPRVSDYSCFVPN